VGSTVLLGILLCVLLALILDTTIVLTGRRLTTWQRAVA
jgi:ABC-type nitrate/sulfonate/bicarbonate transport system permease component